MTDKLNMGIGYTYDKNGDIKIIYASVNREDTKEANKRTDEIFDKVFKKHGLVKDDLK